MRVSLCLYIGVRVRGRARGMCGAGAERLEPSPEHTNRIMLSSTLKRRPPRRCFLPLRFECSETHAGSSMPAVDLSVPPNTYQKRASDLPAVANPGTKWAKATTPRARRGRKRSQWARSLRRTSLGASRSGSTLAAIQTGSASLCRSCRQTPRRARQCRSRSRSGPPMPACWVPSPASAARSMI